MNIGPRVYRQANLRVAIPESLPENMRQNVREIVGVKSSNPRKGDATALMWQTVAEADKYWFTLFLKVEPFADGMTIEKLERFYAKFGFVKIQDMADDGTPAVLMARSPAPPLAQRIH